MDEFSEAKLNKFYPQITKVDSFFRNGVYFFEFVVFVHSQLKNLNYPSKKNN